MSSPLLSRGIGPAPGEAIVRQARPPAIAWRHERSRSWADRLREADLHDLSQAVHAADRVGESTSSGSTTSSSHCRLSAAEIRELLRKAGCGHVMWFG